MSDLDTLSPRQREVLGLLSLGMSTKQVAKHLGIAVGTVQSHTENALAKLDVHSRREAVLLLLADEQRRSCRGSQDPRPVVVIGGKEGWPST